MLEFTSLKLKLKFFLSIFLCFFLGACGSNDSTQNPEYNVTGYAVKGPLVGAVVKVYALNLDNPDFKGRVLGTWKTDENASFSFSWRTDTLQEAYLIEVLTDSETYNINSGTQPVIKTLYTIVTRQQIENGELAFATPYTTLLMKMAQLSENGYASIGGLTEEVAAFESILSNALGFGLPTLSAVFKKQPLLLNENRQSLSDIVAYRTGIEAVGAIVDRIMEKTGAGPEAVVTSIAMDLMDGAFDGTNGDTPVSLFLPIPDFKQWVQSISITTLAIPNTDKDNDPETKDPYTVDEVELMMAREISVTAVDADVAGLLDGSVTFRPAPLGLDSDRDGIPDLSDPDDDNDGVVDGEDAFPLDGDEQLDTDGDGIGNNGDPDDDNDGVADTEDAFPLDGGEQLDTDGDGIGNNGDPDDDNDGVADAEDAFPLDGGEQLDTDNDGIGNNRDPDDDNDGVADSKDSFPLDATEHADMDLDGIGNNADLDDNNDGRPDSMDVFPSDPHLYIDSDIDGIPDISDPDDDNDGVADGEDAFPLDPAEYMDSDSDGIGDNQDAYPYNSICHQLSDGDGSDCHLTRLASEDFETFADINGIVYFVIQREKRILRLDHTATHFLPEIVYGSSLPDTVSSNWITYSQEHHRLYIGYDDGTITYIDLSDNGAEQPFAVLDELVNGLAAVGAYLLVLAQDGKSCWGTRYIFDRDGVLTDRVDWYNYSRVYAWNAANSRVYFFSAGIPPLYIYYETINQATGTIDGEGESPYYREHTIMPPIMVAYDGSLVLLGSGDIYDSEDLTWLTSLPGGIEKGIWLKENELITLRGYGQDTLLERRTSDIRLVERRHYPGELVDIVPLPDGYGIILNTGTAVSVQSYHPSNDTDGDGVINTVDAFPFDPAASVDTDHDGYPDDWNPGETIDDTTTGLILDSYPDDSPCYLPEHGDGTNCNYESTMPEFTPDAITMDSEGIVYLLSGDNNRVFRWSSQTSAYLKPIPVGSTHALTSKQPDLMIWSETQNRLYFGYDDGQLTFVDLSGDLVEQEFATVPMAVTGLAAVGDYLLAQNSIRLNTHYIFDRTGTLTDSDDWNPYSLDYAWNALHNRVYFSPYDLHCKTIDQTTGQITESGETPHSSGQMGPPITVIRGGEQVVLGSGHIYDAVSMEWQDKLPEAFSHAASFEEVLVTAENDLKFWDIKDTVTLAYTLPLEPHDLLAICKTDNTALLVYRTTQGFEFQRVPVGDVDGDGLPEWWEQKYGLDFNALSDDDNDGLSALEEYEHRTDPLVADSDGDGLTDGNEVKLYFTDPDHPDTDRDGLTDYEECITHLTNPNAYDTDNDGVDDPREIQNGLDPADASDASLDADNDGYSNKIELLSGADIYDPSSVPALKDWGMIQGNSLHNGYQPAQLDPAAFTFRWRQTLEVSVTAAATGAMQVYVTGYKTLTTLDALSGDVVWQRGNLGDYSVSTPSFANHLIYVHTSGHGDTALKAFNPETGEQVFTSRHDSQGARYSAPTLFGDTAYMNGGYGGGVRAVNALTGEPLWAIGADRFNNWEPAVSDAGLFHVYGGQLKAVDPLTGADRFVVGVNIPVQTPVIGSFDNVVLRGPAVICVDTVSREILWQFRDETHGCSTVAVGGRKVFAICDDRLVVMDELNGEPLWQYQAPETLTGNIVITLTHVFVSGYTATYAIDLASQQQVWSYPSGGSLCLGKEGALYIVKGNTITAITIVGDSDEDGMPDWWERYYGKNLDALSDEDGDLLANSEEYLNGTHPVNSDTDGDSLSDGNEVRIHHTNPKSADTDLDGLNDNVEVETIGSDPNNPDSDGDGLDDFQETEQGMDPVDGADAEADWDNDGCINYYEVLAGSDINDDTSIPVINDWGMVQGNASHNGYQPLALDAAHFSLRWEHDLERTVSQAATGNGQVYVTRNGRVLALDTVSGMIMWESPALGNYSVSEPGFQNSLVYVHGGEYDNIAFWGFDADTGEEVFRASHGSQGYYSAPTIFEDRAYMNGAFYGGMQAFDALDGRSLWSSTLGDSGGYWEPAVIPSAVLIVDNGDLTFIDPLTGNEMSRIEVGVDTQTPVIGHRHNAFLSGPQVISVDLDSRSQSWRSTVSAQGFGQVVSGNGRVYAVTGRTLIVFNEFSGQRLWTFVAPAPLTSNLIVTFSHVFVGTYTTTYAVDLTTHTDVWRYPASGKMALGREGALYISDGSVLTAVNIEGDTDEDGMPDWWERLYGLSVDDASDSVSDSDEDGLTNLEEYAHGTSPINIDSDNDGLSDHDEVSVHGTSPTNPDTDKDGISDYEEVRIYFTNPLLVDSDADTFTDWEEIILYATDPNDPASIPAAIEQMAESFETGVIPESWQQGDNGDAPWRTDSSVSSDGAVSVRSGEISDSQTSSLVYEGLFTSGTLTFHARVDAESCCDKLVFMLDGVQEIVVPNDNVWHEFTIALPSGKHRLEWRFRKDGSVSRGQDAGWIDNIVFQ